VELVVREADLGADKQALQNVLSENRDYKITPERYEWLYLQNPFGPARAWLAIDGKSGRAIGASAALPRTFWVKGNRVQAHVLSDFSIAEEYRSLGPAAKLNRASIEPALGGTIAFAYDFPSEAMAAVHRWLKAKPLGRMLRYVKILRLDSKMDGLFGRGIVSRSLSWFGNKLLELQLHESAVGEGYSFEHRKLFSDSFDTSFDRLDKELASGLAVCGVRNSAYLNWRYGANPLREFWVLSLLKDKALCGYCVYTAHEKRLAVYDLFCENIFELEQRILKALLLVARFQGAQAIEVSLLETNPWIPIVSTEGFRERPPVSEVFVFTIKGGEFTGLVDKKENWYMTMGDRDT